MTSEDYTPNIPPLPNSPLVEAIFELRWELENVAPGVANDPSWQLMPGIFYAAMKKSFPVNKRLPNHEIPMQMMPYVVRQQFWTAENTWPVIQIGPGVCTVNFASGYESYLPFREVIERVVSTLATSFESAGAEFNPISIDLKYINVTEIEPAEASFTEFLKSSLHTELATKPALLDVGDEPAEECDANCKMVFKIKQPAGRGVLMISNAKNASAPSVMWQLQVISKKEDVPIIPDNLRVWLNDSHKVIERWFGQLTEGPLMNRFKGTS